MVVGRGDDIQRKTSNHFYGQDWGGGEEMGEGRVREEMGEGR